MDLKPNILQHFDCVVVPDCVFIIRLSLLRRTLTTWSADREGWLNGKLCVLLFFLCNHTDDLLSCLACVRPLYLCWSAIVSISNLTQLSWYFAVLRFLCIFKCPPYNILPVTCIHFSPFCRCSRYYLLVLLYFFICANLVHISCQYFCFESLLV